MADTSTQYSISAPAGNGLPLGNTYSLAIGPSIVEKIRVTFPPGCGNTIFVQIRVGGTARYPNQIPNTFHYDSYVWEVDVTNSPDTGDWEIFIANVDFIDHEIQVEMLYNWLSNSSQAASALPASL